MDKKDQILITETQGGDRKRFKQFYLSKKDKFTRWAIKQFQLSDSESLELYQESMARLYEKIMERQINLNSKLEAYLYGLAKNIVRNNFRKNAIQQKHEPRVTEHWQSYYDEEQNEYISKMKNLVVEVLLPQMKEGCRQILKWFYFENRSLENIVSISDYKNKNVVKTQKSRCLQYLEHQLKDVMTKTNI